MIKVISPIAKHWLTAEFIDIQFSPQWTLEKLYEQIDHSESLGLLCPLQNKLVAFVIYNLNNEALDIIHLTTSSEYRRRGMMTYLLRQLMNSLAYGQKIWLEVSHNNNRALSLYLKLGFQVQRERKAYYSDSSHALVMEWVKTA